MDTFNKTVIQVFEHQALSTPQAVAVSDQFTTLTYRQLNEKANQLAHYLHKEKVSGGEFVALLLEPSIEFIVCILGILKAGAAYLPLDVGSPKKRLEKILGDVNPRLLIFNEKYFFTELGKYPKFSIKNLKNITLEFCAHNPIHDLSSQDPIYMIYTSGSTGNAKGVVIPHCAIVNLAHTVNYFSINEKAVIAQFGNLAFDASILEIWSSLLNGGRLSILPLSVRQNMFSLKAFLLKDNITHLFLTTGYFHQIAQFLPEILNPVKMLIFGGEQINPVVVRDFIKYRNKINLPITLVNAYGPTEAGVAICRYVINEKSVSNLEQLSSIGKPIENVRIYILNEKSQRVVPGDVGELCVSGINLALGYHNDETSNREKFTANLFDDQYPFQRFYKTGDLVKQLSNGTLIYVGRTDSQIKIRGFRVDLNEIENQLLMHPAISSAAITTKKDSENSPQLIAYVVFRDEKNILSSHQIRNYLSGQLPSYMIPAKYIKINQLPLTSIGKIDKRGLTTIEGVDLAHVKILPSNDIEKRLTLIYAKILKLDQIDVAENLFDLGLDSLSLIEAHHEINQEFQQPISLEAIITYPSIVKLSEHIHTEFSHINSVELK